MNDYFYLMPRVIMHQSAGLTKSYYSMKYFSPLKSKDIISLIILIVIGFCWTLTDQFFFKNSGQRFIAFILVVLIIFYLQFSINKPAKIWYYANTIALISVSFSLIISIIMHVIIRHDFSVKSVLISLIIAVVPYITGLIYLLRMKKK